MNNMPDSPEISVIMLTYNREKLLGGMIECILKQTFRNFEFIIVDNGSSDKSGEIADNYAKSDSRINVIHRSRGNIGSGRNTGLDAAKGRYIAFIDDDDSCSADYLEFLYNNIKSSSADVSICGATWSDNDEILLLDSEKAIEVLLWRKKYNVAFPTKLFKSKLFDNNRFLETGKYDDIYLMPKILADAEKIVYHGLSKYHFNRHDNNNSAWTQHHELLDSETLSEYLKVYSDRTEWLSEKFPESADKWRYFNFSFMISMVEKVSRIKIESCYKIRDNLREILKENCDEFLNCPWILGFEKNWMQEYVISHDSD